MLKKVLLIALFFAQSVVSALLVSSNEKALADRVVTDIINCNFSSALHVSDSVMNADKGNVLAPVLHLAAIGMRDVDFDGTIDSTRFIKTYDIAIDRLKAYESKNGVSSYSCTLTGLAKAIRSSFYLRLHSYVSALQTGLDALSLLKDARKLDNSNTDVNFFLGLYDYAKADLKKKIWWVMFWYPGDRASGIRQLEECVKSAQITNAGASLSLSDIYISEKKPARSKQIIDEMKDAYPESRFVLWAFVKYLEAQKEYLAAAEAYGILSDSYTRCKEGQFNALVTKNKQAHMLENAGNREFALISCQTVLKKCIDKRSSSIRKDTEKMMERLNGNQS